MTWIYDKTIASEEDATDIEDKDKLGPVGVRISVPKSFKEIPFIYINVVSTTPTDAYGCNWEWQQSCTCLNESELNNLIMSLLEVQKLVGAMTRVAQASLEVWDSKCPKCGSEKYICISEGAYGFSRCDACYHQFNLRG